MATNKDYSHLIKYIGGIPTISNEDALRFILADIQALDDRLLGHPSLGHIATIAEHAFNFETWDGLAEFAEWACENWQNFETPEQTASALSRMRAVSQAISH